MRRTKSPQSGRPRLPAATPTNFRRHRRVQDSDKRPCAAAPDARCCVESARGPGRGRGCQAEETSEKSGAALRIPLSGRCVMGSTAGTPAGARPRPGKALSEVPQPGTRVARQGTGDEGAGDEGDRAGSRGREWPGGEPGTRVAGQGMRAAGQGAGDPGSRAGSRGPGRLGREPGTRAAGQGAGDQGGQASAAGSRGRG